MNWTNRFDQNDLAWGLSCQKNDRSEFQRDYDRPHIFSSFSAARKTKPGFSNRSVFVHNRLTPQPRSGLQIASNQAWRSNPYQGCWRFFGNRRHCFLSARHGNPPWAFRRKSTANFSRRQWINPQSNYMSDNEWKDINRKCQCIQATGSISSNGRRLEDLFTVLLAAIVKYPYASIHADANRQNTRFFEAEKKTLNELRRN